MFLIGGKVSANRMQCKVKSNFLPCIAEVQPNLQKVYCIFYKALCSIFRMIMILLHRNINQHTYI